MDLNNRFETHITQKNLFRKEDLLIIAVSGGVDSMVLTALCRQARYNIVLAHCNFQLRGEESLRDQQFVKAYAEKYQIPFYTVSFDTLDYISLHKVSVQEGARQLRYEWLNALTEKLAAEKTLRTFILTAHHADDQIETLLMHFFRGTGLKGLTGIPEINGNLIRPLLGYTKKELLAYAAENNIQFIQDSSNLSSDYTRNYFRNEIIPAVEKVYPSVKENLLDNIRRLHQVALLYSSAIQPILQKIIRPKGEEHHISIRSLLRYKDTALLYEAIHPFGFTEGQVDEVMKLIHAQSGSYIKASGSGNRIIRHRDALIIAPPATGDTAYFMVEEHEKQVDYKDGRLEISAPADRPVQIVSDTQMAFMDARNIQFPLLLRKWKEGDYFYPLGMQKKKKVARFLIDQKLSATEKERIWVLESNRRIVWVIGQRIDNRFKITDSTQSVLKIQNRMGNLLDKMR